MRNPTAYLKMRVLGAVDMAEGKTERARIQAVSQMIFTDEEGNPRQVHLAHHLHLAVPLPQARRHGYGKAIAR